jgi:hypothetical protein
MRSTSETVDKVPFAALPKRRRLTTGDDIRAHIWTASR